MIKDYYQALGVKKDASQMAIKAAYRMLAQQYHPDKNSAAGAHAQFLEINEAYQTLSDSQKRLRYNYLYDTYILNLTVNAHYQPVVSEAYATQNPAASRPATGYRQYSPPRKAPHRAASQLPEWMQILQGELPYTAPAWVIKGLTVYFIIILAGIVTLGVDYILPQQTKEAPLATYYNRLKVKYRVESSTSGYNDVGVYYINSAAGEALIGKPENLLNKVLLSETALLGIDRQVTVFYKQAAATVNLGAIYEREGLYWLLLLTINSGVGLYFRKSDVKMIKVAIGSGFLLFIVGLVFFIA